MKIEFQKDPVELWKEKRNNHKTALTWVWTDSVDAFSKTFYEN